MECIGDASLIFHNSITFTQNIQHTGKRRHSESFRYDSASVLLKLFICGHECLFRREILSLYQKAYEREPDICYDQLLMITATAAGPTRYLYEDLVFWRRHPDASSYLTSGRSYSTSTGFYAALKAMKNSQKREITRRFFQAFSSYDFSDSRTNQIVTNLSSGTWGGVFKTCLICGLHERSIFYPHLTPIRAFVKSFFTPLYFIRDYTRYLIF